MRGEDQRGKGHTVGQPLMTLVAWFFPVPVLGELDSLVPADTKGRSLQQAGDNNRTRVSPNTGETKYCSPNIGQGKNKCLVLN